MKFRKIRKSYALIMDKVYHYLAVSYEIRKFKDKRRTEIYSKVKLTKEQMDQIDQLYVNYYGKKIPYTWHKHFTAFAGNFDPKFIPEHIYIPEFEKYMNQWGFYADVLQDKNFLTLLANSMDVKMPKLLVYCSRGVFHNNRYKIISVDEVKTILQNLDKPYFVKPSVDSSSGRGCFILDPGCIDTQNIDSVLEKLGTDFTIQELLICHESIRNLYPNSVNTFRVITYNWKGHIYHMPSLMRIGCGGNVLDNAHAGGMFIGIDDSGLLKREAYTEFLHRFTEHPDTKIVFDKYKIQNFGKVLETAHRCHEAVSQLGCINWDFTIDSYGNPVLIEANCKSGSVWLTEEANGCGPFGERTEEILSWLRFMNTLSPDERKKYPFGFGGYS